MGQGELEEWMDPNDPDGTFRRLSDLVRNKRPRVSVGACLTADDLGVCPYCSQESCNYQCWTKRARRSDRDDDEVEDHVGPLDEDGLGKEEWKENIEGLFRLRDHLNLIIVLAMMIKRRGDLPALWNELCRKYQYEEASVPAIGASGFSRAATTGTPRCGRRWRVPCSFGKVSGAE